MIILLFPHILLPPQKLIPQNLIVHAHGYAMIVLETTVGHWPFSDQFQHLANQNLRI